MIDFHTHIFPDAIAKRTIDSLSEKAQITAATDGTLDGLLASMDESGVDLSVIQPVMTRPSQFHTVNTFAAEVNQKYAGRLLSFGGIHPDSEDYKKELETIKELGLLGIKLHPDYQQVMIDDERYMRIIAYADELDLIVLTHAGVDIGLPHPVHCPPDRMRRVLDVVHPKKMVVAHYGGWEQWDAAYEYLAGENVYFDLAFTLEYIKEEMFFKMLEKHGHDKILFATDSPWGGQKEQVQRLDALHLDPSVKEDIFSQNAKRLLNLK